MSFNLGSEISEVSETLRKVRNIGFIKKAKGKEGQMVKQLLQLMDLQLSMLNATSEKVKVAIEARDMTIHHLGEQLMDLRSRDDKPVYYENDSNSKRDPGLYRPDMDISESKRKSMENDMYMQMARLSLGMGGAQALGIKESDFEEKIKEVAADMMNRAKQEGMVRQKVLSVIEEGHRNNVIREKTTEFLLKKKVPVALINECFMEFEESLSFDGSDEEDFSDSTLTPSTSSSNLNRLSNTDDFEPRLPPPLPLSFSPRAESPAGRHFSPRTKFSL
jgi:hypothetical protein